MRAWPERSPAGRALVDAGASCLVVLVLWMTVPGDGSLDRALQIGLAAVAVTGVVLRRRWPRASLLVVVASTSAAWVAGLTADPYVLAATALHSVARTSGRSPFPVLGGAVAVGVVAALALVAAPGSGATVRSSLLSLIVLGGAWAAGVGSRRAQELAIENGVLVERARIARDVHDVLSHSLGTIGVQAGVAAHVRTLDADALRGTLADVERTSRDGIAELGLLLSEMRAGSEQHLPDGVLAVRLRETAAAAERSGMTVVVAADDLDEVPPRVRPVVHAVVREAVTNVIRHAGASRCAVAVHVDAREVRVSVEDDGRGRADPRREGDGVRGMRERLAALGGSLSIGDAVEDGVGARTGRPGVRVTAVVPRGPGSHRDAS